MACDAYLHRQKADAFRVIFHAGLLRVIAADLQIDGGARRPSRRMGGGRRGQVRGFSKASRKRLIEKMAAIRQPGKMTFLTLTYPDAFPIGCVADWKADQEAFFMALRRRVPDVRAIWRMELNDRKSGENRGLIAPHWHLMAFTAAEIPPDVLDELRKDWHRIAGNADENHLEHGFHTAPVRSRRHAMAYVSKYIAKGEGDRYAVGRRWGMIGSFDTSPSQEVFITAAEARELRRIFRSWLKARGQGRFARTLTRIGNGCGFTIFGLGDALDEQGTPGRGMDAHWMVVHARELARNRAREDRDRATSQPQVFAQIAQNWTPLLTLGGWRNIRSDGYASDH